MLSSDLRLRDDKLQRVAAVGLIDGVVEDTDGLQQVASNADLAREVRGVGENLLRLSGEAHGLALIVTVLHGGLDSGHLAALIVKDLIHGGVEHISTAIDSRKTSETLGKLTQAVKGVDVWRLAVTGHGVDIQADAVDGFGSRSGLEEVFIGLVESHGVTNEIASVILQAELVVDLLHRALGDVEAYPMSVS